MPKKTGKRFCAEKIQVVARSVRKNCCRIIAPPHVGPVPVADQPLRQPVFFEPVPDIVILLHLSTVFYALTAHAKTDSRHADIFRFQIEFNNVGFIRVIIRLESFFSFFSYSTAFLNS